VRASDRDRGHLPGADPELEALVWEYADAIEDERFSDAEAASIRMMTLALEKAQHNPDPQLQLQLEGATHERSGDWCAAEAAYREELDRALAENDSLREGSAWKSLSRLKGLLGKYDEAMEYARNALQVKHDFDIGVLRAMLLTNVAVLELESGRAAQSLSLIDDALNLVGHERQFDLPWAMLSLVRADALLAAGDLPSAKEALETCTETIAKLCVMQTAAGAQAAGAHWWEVTARCALAEDQSAAALDAWTNAVAFRRHVVELWGRSDPYDQAKLARTLAEYSYSAARFGKDQLAADLDSESRAIRTAIGLPPL